MGTRNLTAVIIDGQPVVAQYGQWDGHPSGQGRVALDFCRKYLKTQAGRDAFKEKLAKCRWNNVDVEEFLKSIGATDGWLNQEQSLQYHRTFPYLNRDHGAKILSMVNDAPKDAEIILNNSYEFAQDSLSCEYAYVVDLTNCTLEAFIGFQRTPPPQGERFSGLGPDHGGYYPVRLAGSWDLNNLPTYRKFEKDITTTLNSVRAE